MKIITKTFTLIAFVCLAQVISAQTVNQGAWMMGGSAGFQSSKPKNGDSQTSWNLSPNLAYYIADDLAIGLALSILGEPNPFTGDNETFTVLGPYVRYYVADPIFVQVGASLELTDGGGTALGAAVGYSWFLNNSVAIEPALFFQTYNVDGDGGDFTTFGLNIGVQAFVGRN